MITTKERRFGRGNLIVVTFTNTINLEAFGLNNAIPFIMQQENNNTSRTFTDRRDFLKGSAALLGGALMGSALPFDANAWTLNNDPIKIALIGCGSRGAGAAVNALSTKANVVLVAMADVFRDK